MPVYPLVGNVDINTRGRGQLFLVMTHDHGLDQCLYEPIPKRNDFTCFGLIGSLSKCRSYETRMRRRGVDIANFKCITIKKYPAPSGREHDSRHG